MDLFSNDLISGVDRLSRRRKAGYLAASGWPLDAVD
jgi:hypothetical protein